MTNLIIKLGSLDDSVFNGNTILHEISEENNKNRYVYIGGDKIYFFKTDDHVPRYVFNMGNNMIPYSTAVGEKMDTFFSSLHINKKSKY